MMGGAPYDTYTIFFNVYHEPIQFGGGLEHAASQFDIMPADGFADRGWDPGAASCGRSPSHEFFHLWNVKRIRPAEMWPYDYHAEQYTPLLWWSEGVTDYYGDVTNWRAGLWTDDEWLESMQSNVEQVESAPEPWSEEDGSVATWINEVFVNSSQLYYPKGSLTGLLLDISIRDATDNRHSLDEVARNLYTRFYKQGKGFRTADLLALLTEAGLPDARRVLPEVHQRTGRRCPTSRSCPRAASPSSATAPRRRCWASRPAARPTSSRAWCRAEPPKPPGS